MRPDGWTSGQFPFPRISYSNHEPCHVERAVGWFEMLHRRSRHGCEERSRMRRTAKADDFSASILPTPPRNGDLCETASIGRSFHRAMSASPDASPGTQQEGLLVSGALLQQKAPSPHPLYQITGDVTVHPKLNLHDLLLWWVR